MFQLSDFDYVLPSGLIAQYPAYRRGSSRLFVINRPTRRFEHHRFFDIVNFLSKGDLLVLNDTKVLRARLLGRRHSGGKVEVLLLAPQDKSYRRYRALIKPLSRLRKDEELLFDKGFSCRLTDPKEKIVEFQDARGPEVMEKIGLLPLPPYIERSPTLLDRRRYQTVFAKNEGAVAAPTAGLHFSKGLLVRLKEKGVEAAALTLHVNYATFSPVRSQDIRGHHMMPEYYEIPGETVARVRQAKKNRKRVVAVGTTVCKALEGRASDILADGGAFDLRGESRLFIYPTFSFKVVDSLITNFHLPRTSLLMLVSAFAGGDLISEAYREAVLKKYRFYSYGDVMLIV
ncbi:MAG: tRNA preQ1(34) S-adenosylmethionine ribosyltransferase-isomerase QueA [Candidatus Omnitrophica bacterium CG_4_10_14_0_2_um_filter_44_9]|nr:MAG: tRNA preQ1(34) S-adenosylmethionine ribosyltransferase-isomerase QueA [Candidatus Omnitrophica bacterium CG_4_10_14_0_2_um_filter_44_9]